MPDVDSLRFGGHLDSVYDHHIHARYQLRRNVVLPLLLGAQANSCCVLGRYFSSLARSEPPAALPTQDSPR